MCGNQVGVDSLTLRLEVDPVLYNLGVAAGGSALMVALFAVADGGDRVAALGLAHSVAMVAGAGALLLVVGRQAGAPCVAAGSLLRGLTAGVAAGVAARLVVDRLPAGGRPAAALALALGGAAAGAVYLAVQAWLRAPELKRWRAWRLRSALEPAPGGGR
jgi:hypothetical protein